MGQTRLSSITIAYTERSYAILQVSIIKIIGAFGKRKNCGFFMRSVHVLIILLNIGLRRLVQ